MFSVPRDASGPVVPFAIDDDFDRTTVMTRGDWMPDAGAYVAGTREGGRWSDLWLFPADGSTPTKLVGTTHDEHSPALSRDGRALAYVGTETGRAEVYVRTMQGERARTQVSRAGAAAPVWDWERDVLYYLVQTNGGYQLWSATMQFAPTLEVVRRVLVLSDLPLSVADNHANYDVSRDGERFVMVEDQALLGLVTVTDWSGLIRDR